MHDPVLLQLQQRPFYNDKLPVIVFGDHRVAYPTVAELGDDFFFVFGALGLGWGVDGRMMSDD